MIISTLSHRKTFRKLNKRKMKKSSYGYYKTTTKHALNKTVIPTTKRTKTHAIGRERDEKRLIKTRVYEKFLIAKENSFSRC